MPRKSEQQTLYLALAGNGEVNQKESLAYITDFIDAQEDGIDVVAIVPALDAGSSNLLELAAALVEAEVPIEVVVERDAARAPRGWSSVIKAAEVQHQSAGEARAINKILSLVESEAGSSVVALWADDDPFLANLLPKAEEKSIPVRDLTAAFEEIDFSYDEDEDTTTGEEDVPKTTPKTTEPDDDIDEPYTRADLREFDKDELLSIASEDFGLSVRANAKEETIIDRILAAQEEEDGADEPATKPSKGKSAAADEPDDDEELDIEALAEEVIDAIEDAILKAFEEGVNPQLKAISDEISYIREAIETLNTTPEAAAADADDDEPAEKPVTRRRRRK